MPKQREEERQGVFSEKVLTPKNVGLRREGLSFL